MARIKELSKIPLCRDTLKIVISYIDDILDYIGNIPSLNFGIVNAEINIRVDGKTLIIYYRERHMLMTTVLMRWIQMIQLKIVDANTIMLSLTEPLDAGGDICNVQNIKIRDIKARLQCNLIDIKLVPIITHICKYIEQLKIEGLI